MGEGFGTHLSPIAVRQICTSCASVILCAWFDDDPIPCVLFPFVGEGTDGGVRRFCSDIDDIVRCRLGMGHDGNFETAFGCNFHLHISEPA